MLLMSKMAPGRWPAGVLGSVTKSSLCCSGIMSCWGRTLGGGFGEPFAVESRSELGFMLMALSRKGLLDCL